MHRKSENGGMRGKGVLLQTERLVAINHCITEGTKTGTKEQKKKTQYLTQINSCLLLYKESAWINGTQKLRDDLSLDNHMIMRWTVDNSHLSSY